MVTEPYGGVTNGEDCSWLALSVAGLGYDANAGLRTQWRKALARRDEPVVAKVLREFASRTPEVFPPAVTPDSVDSPGIRFLAQRTHFLRYAHAPGGAGRFATDLRASLAVAAALSGAVVELPVASLPGDRGLLLEGTNVFIVPSDAPLGATMVFDGRSGTLRLNGRDVALIDADERWIVGPTEGDWFSILPFDGDFVTFYVERERGDERVRDLVLNASEVALNLELLRDAKRWLREHVPAVWEFVASELLYINWTDLIQMESATDPRESCGSIIVNRRQAQLRSRAEQQAWICHGLYHEAKHLQFFKTYRGWASPDAPLDDIGSVVLASATPRIPCAWKGTPSARSMADHLLALQAFVPGLVAVFHALMDQRPLSQWLRDHIEMDMRAVNGAFGALLLGEQHLSREGGQLFDVIRADYANYLVPAYEALDPQNRVGG
jgi:hypothetical protein